MNVIASVINGFREIWAHKVRSFLSMLGIILGVASLVAMVGVIQGMISSMWVRFEASGGIEKLEIDDKSPPEHQEFIAGLSPGRTLVDVEAIRRNVPMAQAVGGEYDLRWKAFRHAGRRQWAPVDGVSPDTKLINNLELERGRFISDLDMEQKAQVIVIGTRLRDRLFRGRDPFGQTVVLDGNVYKIIGLLKERVHMENGRNVYRWVNRMNYIPTTTALALFSEENKLSRLNVRVHSYQEIPAAMPLIENTLRQTHRGIEDFEIETNTDELQELKALERSFLYSLGSVAAISLLVGALGIMNVMLASVNERIREIGVRKAVGARASDIFTQFVAEAFVISLIGGIIGIMLSVGILDVLRNLLPDGQNISPAPVGVMLAAFVFSVALGLISGIYPALRAARLSPIDALRHE